MSWYRQGTVSVANASPEVVGSGTEWAESIVAGDAFLGPDDRRYEILSVNNNLSLTLQGSYRGVTSSSLPYAIEPSGARGTDVLRQLNNLLSRYSDAHDRLQTGRFGAGTPALPGLGFEDDGNTGLFLLAADRLGITVGGEGRFAFDRDGLSVQGILEGLLRNHQGSAAVGPSAMPEGIYTLAQSSDPTGWPESEYGMILGFNFNPFRHGQICISRNFETMHYRSIRNDGEWSGWSLVTTPATSVRPVTFGVDGRPTGGIHESGSNSNGRYERTSGGGQYCERRLRMSFTSNDIQFVTFPAAFAEPPVCGVHPGDLGNVRTPIGDADWRKRWATFQGLICASNPDATAWGVRTSYNDIESAFGDQASSLDLILTARGRMA
jgi:hypothetical protein